MLNGLSRALLLLFRCHQILLCFFALACAMSVQAQSVDSDAPQLTLQEPAQDNAVIPGEFTFSGLATDSGGSGLRDVRYLLRDLSNAEFISPEGVAESPRVLRTADLDLNDASSGSWSVPVNLSEGRYRLYVRVRDLAGNSAVWAVRTTFTVQSVDTPDETPPSLTLVQPSADVDVLTDQGQLFAGQAEDGDGVGVARVFYIVRNLSSSAYVDNNGNVESPRVLRDAELILAADGSAQWSIPLNLSAGRYRSICHCSRSAGQQELVGCSSNLRAYPNHHPLVIRFFVPDVSDIVDPQAFYLQDGYDTVNVLRMDVATRTTAGNCTPEDDSGCTLDDVHGRY